MFTGGYQAKKDLKAAIGKVYMGYQVSVFAQEPYDKGKYRLWHVGPDAYSRKWYAMVDLQDGVIVKVK